MVLSLSSDEPAAPVDLVKDVTLKTFKDDVLEASQKALVIAVFWTPRDLSCKQLTAALEKIVRAAKGAMRLVRVDIDRDQTIAQQMGVHSVPSVYAFIKGRPVDGFAGALPESQIKTWCDQLLKTAGVTDDEKPGLETAYKQASDMLASGDSATAHAIYTDILAMEPENAVAYAGLVRCCLEEKDLVKARAMLEAAPAIIASDKAFEPVRAALELAEQAAKAGGIEELEKKALQNPDDHQAHFDLALACYAAGRKDEAVDLLLDIVRRARSWNDDGARKQLLKFFEAMGATDPLTVSARRRLSSLLFS